MRHGSASLGAAFAAALLATPPCAAAGLAARLEVPKTEYVQGEPIIVSGAIINAGPEALALAAGRAGYAAAFALEPIAGPAGTLCPADRRPTEAPPTWIAAVPGWIERHPRRFDCGVPPGDYVVTFWVVSGQPWNDAPETLGPAPGRPWSGRADAPPFALRVVGPSGIDREAFDALEGRPLDHAERLLSEFPTSTYAGYALLHGGPWPLDRAAELSAASRYSAIADSDPAARPQIERILEERRAMIRDRIERLDAYLRARPDFVFADFMRRELEIRRAEEEGGTALP
jgi:hypothetical protein